LLALLASCAASQSRFTPLGGAHAARPPDASVDVFERGTPDRPFTRVARLDVHVERTHWVGFELADVMEDLMRQARLAGADAIIEIQERRSTMNLETKVYHVTATGIRYEDR
jgi:hypothetical protein